MKVKIISLNIWNGGPLFDEAARWLKEQSADIVMLQEVYNGTDPNLPESYRTMQRLKDHLGYAYDSFAEAYQETTAHGRVPHGNAIFSKLPITSSHVFLMAEPVAPDYEYRDIVEHWPLLPAPLQYACLDTPAGELNVFNMHGVWDLDGDSYSERRRKMARVVLAAVKNKPNVVLAGDTNAKASNPAMLEIEKELASVFGRETVTTFNMRRKTNPGYAAAAVDLMFVSSNLKVISKEVPDVDISDHLPLVVALEIT